MKVWSISDVGKERETNEDNFFATVLDEQKQQGLFVVCDGMGGAKAGEVASLMATNCFKDTVLENEAVKHSPERMIETAKKALEYANGEILSAAENPEYSGMGTTLVSLICGKKGAVVCNVGDSRAYLIDDNGINMITCDHSLVNEMVKNGDLTEEQALHHPSRHVITRALGGESKIVGDYFELQPKSGQFVLLCSDGLTNEVSEPEIFYEVFQAGNPENACKTLVDLANSRGGSDNITIVLVAF